MATAGRGRRGRGLPSVPDSAEDFTYERLMEWQLNLKEVGRKEWTCRTYLMALKGFSRWLNVHGYMRTDPAARFRTPRLKRVIPLLPSFTELELRSALSAKAASSAQSRCPLRR